MTASVTILTPRKPKRLKTPSDRLSKRELISKLKRAIEKKRGTKVVGIVDLGSEPIRTKEDLEKALGVKLGRIVKFQAKKGRKP